MPRKPAPSRFGAVAAEARRNRPDWKASRDTSLDQRLEVVVAIIGADTALTDIALAKVNAMVRALEARKGRDGGTLSPKTINRYLAVLSAVLTYAHACGYMLAVPPLPWREEAPGRMLFLTVEQEQRLLASNHLSTEERLCVQVLATTGLRPGEFFSLELGQVDIVGALGWLRLWETKTNRPRSVPLDAALANKLRDMIRAGTLPTLDAFYLRLKAAAEGAGLPEGFTTYSLRHTAGTRLAQKQVGGPVIQKWMGHGDYRTTQNYIHLADEDLARAAQVMRT